VKNITIVIVAVVDVNVNEGKGGKLFYDLFVDQMFVSN